MTMCIWVSPGERPGDWDSPAFQAIASDTLATLRDPGSLPTVTPALLDVGQDQVNSRVILARKSYIIDRHTCVAFAGSEKLIRSCLEDAAPLISTWAQFDRPMRRLGDLVNDHRGVECIGVNVSQTTGLINRVSLNNPVQFKYLGQCAAIGSGGLRALELCGEFDRTVSGELASAPQAISDVFFSSMAASVLAREIVGRGDPGWGGYIEHLAYDWTDRQWVRAPSTIHFFFLARTIKPGVASVDFMNRVVAYDGQSRDGRILSAAATTTGHVVAEFVLKDIPHGDGAKPATSADSFWRTWKPARATVSVILVNENGGADVSTRLIGAEGIGRISFSFQGPMLTAAVEPELTDDVLNDALGTWGLRRELI